MSGCQQNMEARNWLGERVSKACGKPAVALRYGVSGPSPYAVCPEHVYGRMKCLRRARCLVAEVYLVHLRPRCDHPAVAVKIDGTPVCVRHAQGREDLQALGLWGRFRARLAREVWAAKEYRP